MKKIISFCIVVACSFISSSNAHIQHHNKLNLIQFDIFREDSKVGYHHIVFTRNKGEITVQNEISFDIKKLGISFYQYKSKGTEIYAEDGSLLSFISKTSDNGTIKSCNINRQGKSYIINGTQYKGTFNKDFLISKYWNHEILKKNIIGKILSIRSEVGQYLPSWRPDSDYKNSVSAKKKLGGLIK